MSSRSVEFRLLQVVRNPVGDERHTVALLHWDGRQIRFAWNRAIPKSLKYTKDDIKMVLDAIHKAVSPSIDDTFLPFGMDLIFNVQEGTSSIMAWGSLRKGVTRDPEAHFNELATLLGLYVPGKYKDSVGSPVARGQAIASKLSWLGDRLRRELDDDNRDRVQTRFSVRGLREYQSPLSWLNGRWHHSFPLNFVHSSAEDVVDRFQRTLGRIDVSVPSGQVGVILAVHPDSIDFDKKLRDVEGFVHDRFNDRVECMRAPIQTSGAPAFDKLAQRIKFEVGLSTAVIN